MSGNNKIDILNVNISNVSMQQCIEKMLEYAEGNKGTRVAYFVNPRLIVFSQDDRICKNALNNADMVLPDGIGIVFASRLQKEHLPCRVCGPTAFLKFSEEANQKKEGLSYFFLGSSEEVLEKIKNRIKNEYPNIIIKGVHSPSFSDQLSEQENEKIVALINSCKPDVLWVGMSAPKQEKWIYKNKDKLNVPLICGIGAAFDFFAGTKKRAPRFIRRIGFEWLYRFKSNPGLWKRYFIVLPRYVYLLNRQLVNSFFRKQGKV